MPLSERRAQAVRNQIVTAGIPANTVTSLGMGSADILDAGASKDAQAKNRRVEIEITVDQSKVPKT
jgi:outer membrane protein OmpA-like peptidoglycan-associated protein